jgi:hypothetical protein
VCATLVMSIVACNLLIDTDAAQCSSNAECESRFPGSGRVCEGFSCVNVKDAEAVDAAPEAAAPECTLNAECMDREAIISGGPAICVKGKCQKIVGDDGAGSGVCFPELMPTGLKDGTTARDLLRKNDVIVIGALLRGGSESFQQPTARAYNLALREIQQYGGVPIGPNDKARPLVMVVCRTEPNQPALGEKSLAHLVDLGVPAVLALFDPTTLLTKATELAEKGVFTMNPSDTTAALRYAPAVQGFAWHLLGTTEDVSLTYRPVLARVEDYVRKKATFDGPRDVKVALLATNFTADLAAADTIVSGAVRPLGSDGGTERDPSGAIVFNDGGSTPADTINFKPFIGLPVSAFVPGTERDTLVAQLKGFQPDIIIAATSDVLGGLVDAVDKAMKELDGGIARLPVWVLSTRNSRDAALLTYLANANNEAPNTKYTRFLGVQYAGSTEPVHREKWLERMSLAFGGDTTQYAASENFYDAIYWLAYGLYASGLPTTGPVQASGASLKVGVRNLLSGPRVFPGADGVVAKSFATIHTQLIARSGVTYVGALGPRDIDPSSGTIFGTGALYCYEYDGLTQKATVKYDIRRYNPDGGELLGDPLVACYVNFP